ncbi:MAG TPA: amidohydrolase family protein, partial [Isosphaeraceae bacterium]|nr:amidohydrolase family protein [Isosphaeraceae bacterium]
MKPREMLLSGRVILEDRVLTDGSVLVRDDRIAAVGPRARIRSEMASETPEVTTSGYIAPGFVDLHVHGGCGADFMDGTEDAFRTVLEAHARHGTTSLLPTSTAAAHEPILTMLGLCRHFREQRPPQGARVLGAHFYGPYFRREARGCHPSQPIREPDPRDYEPYLEFADAIVTASVAPELDGAEAFARACVGRGIRVNAGHTYATFDQMTAALQWGVRHVDHLFCAMSDRAKLRVEQPYPMRGGVLEATLYHDDLTTEVIADGKHLSAELLQLAWKIKGPDRLALVTDCNRALDLPEGPYVFGPLLDGEPFVSHDGVGKTPDGQALASSVMGMEHMVRT